MIWWLLDRSSDPVFSSNRDILIQYQNFYPRFSSATQFSPKIKSWIHTSIHIKPSLFASSIQPSAWPLLPPQRYVHVYVLKPKTQSCLQLVVSSYFANYSDKTNKRRNLFDQTTNIWHVFFIISELSRIFSSFFALYSLTWKVFSCGLDVG